MPSKQTAEQLRFAVAAGRYADVEALLDRYAREVEAAWHAASPEDRQSLAAGVLTLLRWAQRTMLASRSHAQMRQVESSRRLAYARGVAGRSSVEIDG